MFLQNAKQSHMFLAMCSKYGAPAVRKCQLMSIYLQNAKQSHTFLAMWSNYGDQKYWLMPCSFCSMPSCRVECWSWSKRTSSGCCTHPLHTEPLAWGAYGTEMCTLTNNKNYLWSFSFALVFNYLKCWRFIAWAEFFFPRETQVGFIYNTMHLCLTLLKTDPLYSASHQY